MYKQTPVVIVAAMEKRSRAIGNKNQLLWHIPDDLKRFKQLTLGYPVIMGRKTFESIVALLGKPLPGRTNIVITRDEAYAPKGAIVAHTLNEAFVFAAAERPAEIHIGGGAALYTEALPFVDRIHITLVDDESVAADTYFPDFAPQYMISKVYPEAAHDGLKYQWVDFTRLPK